MLLGLIDGVSDQLNQRQKASNERLFILTRTQYANFRGNPLCQATKRHLSVWCSLVSQQING